MECDVVTEEGVKIPSPRRALEMHRQRAQPSALLRGRADRGEPGGARFDG